MENKFSDIYTKFYLTVNVFMKININIWSYKVLTRGYTGRCILVWPQSFDHGIYRIQQHAFLLNQIERSAAVRHLETGGRISRKNNKDSKIM